MRARRDCHIGNISGKYLEVEPMGITHLEFPKSGNHYTWRKVKTVVHNIVIGKLWIDQVRNSHGSYFHHHHQLSRLERWRWSITRLGTSAS